MDARAWQIRAQRWTAHRYPRINALAAGLALLLLAVWLAMWRWLAAVSPPPGAFFSRLVRTLAPASAWLLAGLAALGLAGLLFVPAFPAWYSNRVRNAAWWTAKQLGTFWRNLPLLIGALVLGLGGWALWPPGRGQAGGVSLAAWGLSLLQVLVALILLNLLWTAWRARRSLVILNFADHTGDPALKAAVQGLATRLRAELVLISSVYDVPDEAWTRLPEDKRLALSVQDPGDLLKDAVTPDTRISLGFLHIPLGPILAAFSRLVQGPRLSGSLDRSERGLLLVAEVYGGGFSGIWRVGAEDVAGSGMAALDAERPPVGATLDPLPELLAYRILTDLVPVGSTSWRAVRAYTRGLAAYRETQRSKRDISLKLLGAERQLLQALDEDNSFARCHYNLGVIYSKLGRLDSADAAFRRALDEGHDPSEACLSLANLSCSRGRYDQALRYCDDTLRHRPAHARAWQLAGLAHRRLGEQKAGAPLDRGDPIWKTVLICRESAVALAFRALCASAVRGRQDAGAVRLAGGASRDLGIAYAQVGRRGRGAELLRQALRLQPLDQTTQLELGKVLFDSKDYLGAIACFGRTPEMVVLPGARADLWWYTMAANLELAQGPKGGLADLEAATASFVRMLDPDLPAPAPISAKISSLPAVAGLVEQLVAAHTFCDSLGPRAGESDQDAGGPARYQERLSALQADLVTFERQQGEDEATYLDRLCEIGARAVPGQAAGAPGDSGLWRHELRQWAELLAPRPEESTAGTRKRLAALAPLLGWAWSWARAQLLIRLATSVPGNQTDAATARVLLLEAAERLEQAISLLGRRHQHQIRSHGLHGTLADLCLRLAAHPWERRREFLNRALLHAELAVDLEPESAWERTILGRVYSALRSWERAEAELTASMALDPNDPEAVQQIAMTFWNRGVAMQAIEPRRKAFRRVIDELSRSLDLIEGERLQPGSLHRQMEARGWTHYWLGRFYGELLRYDEACTQFTIALAMEFKPVEAAVNLAYFLYEARAYDRAEEAYRQALRSARDHRRSGRTSLAPASAQGEETPINSLMIEIFLGWALLKAEAGVDLDAAARLNRQARCRIRLIARERRPLLPTEEQGPVEPRQVATSRYHECEGLLRFQSQDYAGAIVELQRSLDLARHSTAYLYLARCQLALARTERAEPARRLLDQAREACRRVRETDIRGRLDHEAGLVEKLLDGAAKPTSGASRGGRARRAPTPPMTSTPKAPRTRKAPRGLT